MTLTRAIRAATDGCNPLTGNERLSELYTAEGVAQELGVSVTTFKTYVYTGRVHGPDGHVGHVPVWHEKTLGRIHLQRSQGGRNHLQAAQARRRADEAAQTDKRFETDPDAWIRDLTDDELVDTMTSYQERGIEVPALMVQLVVDRGLSD